MEYQIQLQFFQNILKGLFITSSIIENPSVHISSEIDLRLREHLFEVKNYTHFLKNSMLQAKDNTIYRFFDEYDCYYIFLRLPNKSKNKDSYFFIGPYLLDMPSQEQIAQKSNSLDHLQNPTQLLYQYYTELPIIENENLLLSMANTLAIELWGKAEHFSLEYIDYMILDQHKPIVSTPNFLPNVKNESTLSLQILEQTYASEKLLMEAVSKGQLHLVTTVASSIFTNGTQPRVLDSLRNRKNYLIILKTLLRKAAEYGGVHPLHIHRLSSHFAEQIEAICTIKQSLTLQEDMIRSYCLLVKHHSLNQYSYYVEQTITIVQCDLTADLRLKTIAEKLNVNSSYLSALFHKEYGCTLTEFVNQERVNHAIMLLKHTAKSVQEIAVECGIQDTTYFIKVFKKKTGLTPNQYREKVRV